MSDDMNFAWGVASKLCKLSENEREEIFGYSKSDTIIALYTVHQVNFKIEEYKKKEEIHVGDIVTIDDGDLTFVCTKDNSSGDYNMCHLLSFDGSVWEDCKKSSCKRTGKTIDISEILKQIN